MHFDSRIGNNTDMVATIALAIVIQSDNTLTPAESKAGWMLLFDGNSTSGWHNFRGKGVNKGWVVEDGALRIADPDNAGDIVTDRKFTWFELTLDVKIEKGQNSGIMFHVTEGSEASWHSGPEIQIYDHAPQKGVETTGFLYQLYASPVDASKPAGEWNSLRILVSPTGCATWVNGVKYYEYQLGSADFWDRVKKSKFNKYSEFARAGSGSIAIQGDHGHVSFRNIKIRKIQGAAQSFARRGSLLGGVASIPPCQ